MSYTPGTKLSHTATHRATVLTGDNVMVTLGLGVGQMMKLADWLILADGAKIQEEYIPVPKDGAAFIPVPAASAPLPDAASDITPTPPPPAIGTKFRWTLKPETYRVFIMTAKGLLQVKSVTDGAGEVHPATCECLTCRQLRQWAPTYAWRPLKKTLFADEAAWRASLPTGGSVVITPPAKPVSEQKLAVVAQAPNDLEKLKAIIKTYKIRTSTLVEPSPQERLKYAEEKIAKLRADLAAISLELDLQWPHVRNKLTRQLKRTVELYYSMKIACNCPNSHVRSVKMQHSGTGFIVGVIGGALHFLTVHEDQIAASSHLHYGNVRLYKNLAEIGSDLKLVVKYHGREISL
jgi:hypothetical protein